ncbi:MAG TPA: ATP-binding protein [Arachidicoccus sp.]|nr:ATP-binding protein [Arachidicoccus sp.]
MSTEELERLIEGQSEHPGLDFKRDCSWDVKRLAKDILAMSNIRDGGMIVIGVEEFNNEFIGKGVSNENLKTFVIDEMKDQLLKYADPYVEFSVKFPRDRGGRQYVVIKIFPFKEVPVICKRDLDKELRASTIYYRNTNRRVESAAISNFNDLREIIELAAIRLMQRRQNFGYSVPENDFERYKSELNTVQRFLLAKKIRSRGYSEVNFVPLESDKISSLGNSLEIVRKSQVRLNWDLPFIPNNSTNGSLHPADECYQGESDMGCRKEFWRIYLSQQFFMLNALTEDWYEEDGLRINLAANYPPGKYLMYFTSVLHYITQTFSFLERMARQGLYKNGVRVSIQFFGTEDRQLYIDPHNRMPLLSDKITKATKISVVEDFTYIEITEESLRLANSFIIRVFDYFGFYPQVEAIQIDQVHFLNSR